MSRPGQEDLSFWVNHNGLLQFDVEGEVGFGDMARVLLRRRANAATIRDLRDRFTFRVQDPAASADDGPVSCRIREWRSHLAQRACRIGS